MVLADRADSANGGGREASVALYYLLEASLPANGAQTRVWGFTGGAGVQGRATAFAVHTDRQQVAPSIGAAGKWQGATTVSPTMGPKAYTNDMYGISAILKTANQTSTMPSPWTERFEAPGSSSDTNMTGGDVAFSGAGDETLVYTNAISQITAGLFATLAPLAVGPTITTQPTAATAVVDPSKAAAFTVAATGVGLDADSVVWEVDGSPVSDGGIYDIVTTPSGDGTSVTSVLTVTPTTSTGTPFDVQASVTDDNGTVDSDLVALTVKNGVEASATIGPSNASGAASGATSSDYVNPNGEFTEVEYSSGAKALVKFITP